MLALEDNKRQSAIWSAKYLYMLFLPVTISMPGIYIHM